MEVEFFRASSDEILDKIWIRAINIEIYSCRGGVDGFKGLSHRRLWRSTPKVGSLVSNEV